MFMRFIVVVHPAARVIMIAGLGHLGFFKSAYCLGSALMRGGA